MNLSEQGNTGASLLQNDFKPFATNQDANVIEQAEYETLAARGNGFKKGLARSTELNKALRQSSSMTAAIARFAAAKTGEAILDNGDIDTLSSQIEAAIRGVSSLSIAEAEGLADALTARFTPTVKELKQGLPVHVRAKHINTSTTPTFSADKTGEKPVVKGNNLPLATGDIAGAGHWLEMQYDEALDKWVLQNPAKGITPQTGLPAGTIEYFAMATPPAGYLKADGAAVGRETYPELFAAIGTTFGEGNGSTTFNLPDLIDRFAQGSATPGQKIEAGLPNIMGAGSGTDHFGSSGSFRQIGSNAPLVGAASGGGALAFDFAASRSNPIYGASDTVQPPALTLLPCIKAFDAATNPGLVDITGLANDVADFSANKLDKTEDGTAVKYITGTFNDSTNWYRRWSDGWLEQGGTKTPESASGDTINFPLAFAKSNYTFLATVDTAPNQGSAFVMVGQNKTTTSILTYMRFVNPSNSGFNASPFSWYACGQGAQS